jgi:hypothetical protein
LRIVLQPTDGSSFWNNLKAAEFLGCETLPYPLARVIIGRRFQIITPRVPRVLPPGLGIQDEGFWKRDSETEKLR